MEEDFLEADEDDDSDDCGSDEIDREKNKKV